jgi:hypothetical protein
MGGGNQALLCAIVLIILPDKPGFKKGIHEPVSILIMIDYLHLHQSLYGFLDGCGKSYTGILEKRI